MIPLRQPHRFGIWYSRELICSLSLDDLLLTLDDANLQTRILGTEKNFVAVQTEERFSSILAGYEAEMLSLCESVMGSDEAHQWTACAELLNHLDANWQISTHRRLWNQ